MDPSKLRTIPQLAGEFPAFSERNLRWLVYDNKQGFADRCVVRIGRKVLIHVEEFADWLDENRAGEPKGSRATTA